MNIYDFTGATERKHAVQLVKHWDEVPDGKKVKRYMAQKKEDGVFAAVCLCGGWSYAAIFGRTGLKLTNVEHLEAAVYKAADFETPPQYSRDGVYIAELVADNCSLEQLSGIVNPNRTEPLTEEQEAIKRTMRLCYHDFVTIGQFIRGQANVPYLERFKCLGNTFASGSLIYSAFDLDTGKVEAVANEFIAAGWEGAVFKDPNAPWIAGHKGFHSMKIVRGVFLDLRCTGHEEGKGKYAGKVANLLFKLQDGREFKAMLGKGYTHEDAERMFLAIQHNDGPHTNSVHSVLHDPRGKIFCIYGLQPSSKNGLIRLPKVGELRHDKTEPDFPSAN